MSGEALEAWAIKEQWSFRAISMLKTSCIYRRHRSYVEDIATELCRHLLNQQPSGFSFFVLKLKTSALRVQTTNPAVKTCYYFCVKTGNNLLWSETYTSLCAQGDTQVEETMNSMKTIELRESSEDQFEGYKLWMQWHVFGWKPCDIQYCSWWWFMKGVYGLCTVL